MPKTPFKLDGETRLQSGLNNISKRVKYLSKMVEGEPVLKWPDASPKMVEHIQKWQINTSLQNDQIPL